MSDEATAPPPLESDGDAEQSQPRQTARSILAGHGLELLIAVALGLAAMVSAFAAYRNEQRNHDATEQFSLGVRNFDDAGQFYTNGNFALAHDQAVFLEYAQARQQHNGRLTSYIFDNLMDSRLQAAVRWWQGPNAKSAHPAATPFTAKDPDYQIPHVAEAADKTAASTKNFAEARRQQERADHFTLVEVILSTALFMYGIAGVASSMTLKVGALAIGGLIFLISVVLLVTG